jgi:hypothetical protein
MLDNVFVLNGFLMPLFVFDHICYFLETKQHPRECVGRVTSLMGIAIW